MAGYRKTAIRDKDCPLSITATNEVESALDVADIADELVALWESPNIRGLPRAERNAAIDGTREKLTAAVNEWRNARKVVKHG